MRCDATADRRAGPCGCSGLFLSGRRGFLRGAGAIAAAACLPAIGTQAAAQTPPGATPPAPSAAAPFRIDVHHHYTSPALLAMMKGRRTHQTFNEQWTVEKSLDAMQQGGVATAVVSTSDPGVFFGDYDAARALARDCNDYQARLVADHKGRFGMFTTVPLPDIDTAIAEVAYGLDTLKAQGVGVMTSYQGKYLGDPAFAPFMDEMNRRRAVVFVHPLSPVCCTSLVPGVPDQLVEFNSETSRTIGSLLFSGTLARCPDIRFIFSHGGGTVPYLTVRFERLFAGRADLMQKMPQGALAVLRTLYFDTAQAANAPTLAAMTRMMPSQHILFGSDFPAAPPTLSVQGLGDFGFDATTLRGIERDNALTLMPSLS